jgi:hypothetical protein
MLWKMITFGQGADDSSPATPITEDGETTVAEPVDNKDEL